MNLKALLSILNLEENESETENEQNNESKKANYNVDDTNEVIGKVQKSGKKGFFQDDTQLKKRNIIFRKKI